MKPLKPALTYREQVEHLRAAHGLEIDDEDKAVAILSRVNYYRLSAYGLGLRRADDPERFMDGVSLSLLYRLYRFDLQLRNLLLPAIEAIEIELRTKVAYQLALAYGPEGYLDPSNFRDVKNKDGTSVHQKTMDKFRSEVERQSELLFVRHHQIVYGGHFPIWVAVELFSFGMLASFYSIMKGPDREAIAACFDEKAQYLSSWYFGLVDLRNRCAHYGRIYNMPLRYTPKFHKEQAAFAQSHKVYSLLFIIKRLLEDRPEWSDLAEGLVSLFQEFPEAQLNFMDFPDDWKAQLGI